MLIIIRGTTNYTVNHRRYMVNISYQHVYDSIANGMATRRGPRDCALGPECYAKNEDHLARYSHPSDEDWDLFGDAEPGAGASSVSVMAI